jgi:tRNA G18 (ribose-2'-O)-methylase SpoU
MDMRGYFGIGVERLSKPMNAGNLFRSAQALGAGFLFTVAGSYALRKAYSDTSQSTHQLPFYEFDDVPSMMLPNRCQLVGIELIEGAVDLPTFRHPIQAAYVLGPERGSLSPDMLERCDHVIKIPTTFCINVATAGAIVMYDRIVSLGRFGQRATFSRNPGEARKQHVQGAQKFRTKAPN